MWETIKNIGMVVGMGLYAPIWFMKWPSFRSLKVKSVKQYEAEAAGPRVGKTLSGPLPYHFRGAPKRTVIQFQDSRGSGYNLILSHEDQTVDCNDGGFLTEPYGGSAEIGIFLIGLPGLLVFSPLLILNGLVWKAIEMATGMNRYAWSVWLRLKSQVDPETRERLRLALQHA